MYVKMLCNMTGNIPFSKSRRRHHHRRFYHLTCGKASAAADPGIANRWSHSSDSDVGSVVVTLLGRCGLRSGYHVGQMWVL